MDLHLNLGQWIVIGLSAFLSIWYFIVLSQNRRRGLAAYRWLYRCLGEMGKVSHAEWIGSSNIGARLVVRKATKPFRYVEASYRLEPREFLPYWLFSRLRGKKDEVVIRVTLHFDPKASFEINKREIRDLLNRPPAGELVPQDPHIANADPAEIQARTVANTFLSEFGASVEKMVLQREAPHLMICARLKPLLRSPAESFLKTLLRLFQNT